MQRLSLSLMEQDDYIKLQQCLPQLGNLAFKITDETTLIQIYPLLALLSQDRDIIKKILHSFKITPPIKQPSLEDLTHLCHQLKEHPLNRATPIPYRLPTVIGEFPIHTYSINQAIKQFNAMIENHYHQTIPYDPEKLETYYREILTAIQEHGAQCDPDSVWQLMSMLTGWSTKLSLELFAAHPFLLYPPSMCISQAAKQVAKVQPVKATRPIISESREPNKVTTTPPFVPDYNYNFNSAGLLTGETNISLHKFGMKLGGHLDAQVKHLPQFIPFEQLHAIIYRQLSHRMAIPNDENFNGWIQKSLADLGVKYIAQSEDSILANPFLVEPILSLNPEKIREILERNLKEVAKSDSLQNSYQIDIVSQYLFELLQGFQINSAQALGIGANFDGTISSSNAAGTAPFKFLETEADWASRFKELCLHRQGPSEAYMNAGRGVQYELEALVTGFDYMTQLKPSEYHELLYSALVDNIVAELFPHPGYFENTEKRKFRHQHVVQSTPNGEMEIVSYYVPSETGTFFEFKPGAFKQTPLHRQAGTLEVMAFPRDVNCSEDSRACYAGDPLGPLQLQYAQAMHRSARGHVVYNPTGPDQFLPDFFNGQVVQSENGNCVPYIGVMPKNFDKQFKLPQELCASFVIRMLQSARIMEYCPTFRSTVAAIQCYFLPAEDKLIPALPESYAATAYLVKKHRYLAEALANKERNFSDCRKKFFSLFKRLIEDLYQAGAGDEYFESMYSQLCTTSNPFESISRANCEKIIRHFIINKPIQVFTSENSSKVYDEKVDYLRTLTTYFYPTPTEELASSIAKLAKSHATALLQTDSVNQYFSDMKKWQQINLSRKQTPGMAYAVFKHGGPSKTILHDYSEMHTVGFKSGYRDSEGNQISKPQRYERALDWSIKKVGALLQFMHRYHLFAIAHRPFTQAYVQAKELSHKHARHKKLWKAAGVIKGFFWNGILGGIIKTTTTPLFMLYDAGHWLMTMPSKSSTKENPLAISSAPANEPNLKVKTLMASRDHILNLLDKNPTFSLKKIEQGMLSQINRLIGFLYPTFTPEQARRVATQFSISFPHFDSDQWKQVTHPFATLPPPSGDMLQKYYSEINEDFVRSVFRCLTDPGHAKNPEQVIKKNKSICKLNKKQEQALNELVSYYNHLKSPNDKKLFLEFFQFGGKIQRALRSKDKQLQRIQNWFAVIFDEHDVLDILFLTQIDRLIVTPTSLQSLVLQLSDSKKERLLNLLKTHENEQSFAENKPSILDQYVFAEDNAKEKMFLQKCKIVFDKIDNQQLKTEILQCCEPVKKKNDALLSVKDKEQNKWAAFSEREFKHELLSRNEVDKIFSFMASELKKSSRLLNDKKEIIHDNYGKLLFCVKDDLALEIFFNTTRQVLLSIRDLIKSGQTIYREAEALLENFINITMNAVINSRLDQENIFSLDAENRCNPLSGSPAIQNWLVNLSKNNRDLKVFINQQVQQSPSLDHALHRNDCIFAVLEKFNGGRRIQHTGIQSIVRMRQVHKENTTKTGKRFFDTPSVLSTPKSLEPSLLCHSETMRYAMERVAKKV